MIISSNLVCVYADHKLNIYVANNLISGIDTFD
jgi:hypothetical protein